MGQDKNPQVILVEDDQPLARLMIYCLQQAGFSVEHIMEGRSALEMVNRQQLPALIIIDYLMPYANGLRVTNALRADSLWQAVPIICISDLLSEDTMIGSLRLRSDGFLTKPIQPEKLVKLAKRLSAPDHEIDLIFED
ncbi:MAG: response regulator transcription factor [Immundisolibacteraceae bacterium]|nr:response regulator transcription factor [Immundisolibacteraceae bacterium]